MNEEARKLLSDLARALYGDEIAEDEEFLEKVRRDLVDSVHSEMVSIPVFEKWLRCELSAQRVSGAFRELFPSREFNDDFQPKLTPYMPGNAYIETRIPFPEREISREICEKLIGFLPIEARVSASIRTDGNINFSVQYNGVMTTDDDTELEDEIEYQLDAVFQKRLRQAYADSANLWDITNPLSEFRTVIPVGFYEFLQGLALAYLRLLRMHSDFDKDTRPDFSATVTETETVFRILTSPLYGFEISGEDLPEIRKTAPRDFSVTVEPSDDTDRFYITIIIPRAQPTD